MQRARMDGMSTHTGDGRGGTRVQQPDIEQRGASVYPA